MPFQDLYTVSPRSKEQRLTLIPSTSESASLLGENDNHSSLDVGFNAHAFVSLTRHYLVVIVLMLDGNDASLDIGLNAQALLGLTRRRLIVVVAACLAANENASLDVRFDFHTWSSPFWK